MAYFLNSIINILCRFAQLPMYIYLYIYIFHSESSLLQTNRVYINNASRGAKGWFNLTRNNEYDRDG